MVYWKVSILMQGSKSARFLWRNFLQLEGCELIEETKPVVMGNNSG